MDTAPSERFCQQACYEDLFLRLRDAAVLLDPVSFEILDANDAAELLLGYSNEKLNKKPFLELVASHQQNDQEKILRVTRRRYHPREWEALVLNDQSEMIPVRITGCVLKLKNESEALQLLIRDIRPEKAAERKIQDTIVQLEQLNQKLETLSTTDEMTRLANFRHFTQQLQQEHARSSRYQGVYSLVFFDVDHFKHYNDRNGHPAGDALLRLLAEIVRKSCRDTDLPARYGGEEFVILCPEVTWEKAMILAERVRANVENAQLPFGNHQPLGRLSVSVGVASFPAHGATSDQILKAADTALYEAKKSGRNRIIAAPLP